MTVSEAFAELTENILSHEGFKIRYTIRKKKYPGKHSRKEMKLVYLNLILNKVPIFLS